ncbi:phosphatase PAP2 family protein [Nocardia sp. NPDC058633]|uniref:phosphatase PAP2 family protein n=1 Tax=Nocardia sp. NPDC058633 TaxID=3346568 RepID=UPI00365EB4E5
MSQSNFRGAVHNHAPVSHSLTPTCSFPSNHSAVAAAVVASLWFVDKRLTAIAALAVIAMAASRVYVGAHYPHDVAAGLLVGTLIGLSIAMLARRWAPPLAAVIDPRRTRSARHQRTESD